MKKVKNVVLTVSQKVEIDVMFWTMLESRKADLIRYHEIGITGLLVDMATEDITRLTALLEALDKENYYDIE